MAKRRAPQKGSASRRQGSTQRQKRTPSAKREGGGARSGAGAARTAGRKTAGARTPKGKAARKKAANPPRAGKVAKRASRTARPSEAAPKRGGSGREETLAQTPETGRTVRGRTNPLPTRRSTGTAAGAGSTKDSAVARSRRQLREVEESVPTPPSSLDLDRTPSAARSGRAELLEAQRNHTETGPALTGGDVDASWSDAYAVGDEAPGGDNPTPDQDRVDDIGKALGVEYQDNEELRASDKIAARDRKRWELDPASSEDYKERE